MGYVLKAVLSSAQHPEYGQITVPFPIPDEKYDRMIELLEPLEIGDALRQDCRVDELDSFYTVLNRLVGSLVNFDELDYLAKRLDSFDDGEAAQFQGMACKLGVSNIKDFINLTFCCQQATVITDFSDLDAIGRQHYMTMQGGGCRIEELERLDGRKFALDLILNHLEGRITPYGVVYDTVGHLRMDFGHGEKEFWHTWWPHNEDRFNTPEFKEVLQRFVDDLRQTGLLKNLGAMDAYCWQHGGSITEDRRSYGYIAETENYRFCLRCTPFPGEYQGYLYCYDLCQQEMYRQEHPVVGRVTFASGEQQEFTDSKALLQAIREELPFRSTTGFRFETLTDDPEVKKAVDDILLDFAGEDNSRRTCNYGLTETGKQALRKAADPSIPHTYAWFVMADTNTPQEIIRQDLTLEEAIQIYQDSNTSEKRLGVIKDGIATVDFVHFQSGEQQFFTDHEKLESFRSDLVVAEAMERLYQQLNQPDIGIRMGEM